MQFYTQKNNNAILHKKLKMQFYTKKEKNAILQKWK